MAAAKGRGIETFDFPPGDLLQDLIDIHFRTSHCTMPVVHEPKFRKNVQERLHHYDLQFGKLVMMMCALASRDSDDPRVLLPGEKESSAGWKYYEQVEIVRKSMFEPPELHELQMYCVSAESSNSRLYLSLLINNPYQARYEICSRNFSTARLMDFSQSWITILSRVRYTSKKTAGIPGDHRRRGEEASLLVCWFIPSSCTSD